MKHLALLVRAGLLVPLTVVGVSAATHYVWLDSPSPSAPYTSWETAAHSIQAAVDSAVAGETVLVTNGVYATGEHVVAGFHVKNRVVLTNAITVRSVNGPDETLIVGQGPSGLNAVRCVYLTNSAVLTGFTLSNGHSYSIFHGESSDQRGGGCMMEGSGTISNCVLRGNKSGIAGGGAYCNYGAGMYDCLFEGNDAPSGGGVYCDGGSMVSVCTVRQNTAQYGGGAACANGGTVADSEITGNWLSSDGRGGGVACQQGGLVTRCTISHNSAPTSGGTGGGVYCEGTVYDCRITENRAYLYGGGVRCYTGGVMSNCVISANSAYGPISSGGGVYCFHGGTLYNCFISGNDAYWYGGGVYCVDDGLLNNCTISGNRAVTYWGGGVHFNGGGSVRNSIIYFNTAPRYPDHDSLSRVRRCCTPYGWASLDNVTNAPMLGGIGNPHIAAQSPCIDGGSNSFASGIDIDGEPRIHDGIVDIGCDEYIGGGITGALTVAIIADSTSAVADTRLTFTSGIEGKVSYFTWRFDDGELRTNATQIRRTWSAPGNYPMILTAFNNDWPAGRSATVTVHIVGWFTNYVSLTGTHTPPFTSWATAATNLQDAVDVCPTRGSVRVADGQYGVGGYVYYGASNRVGLYKPVTVASVNGPGSTMILGNGPLGPGATRCAYLTAGSSLSGFTLQGGHTVHQYNYHPYAVSGGGALLDEGGRLSNCIVQANVSHGNGGGVVCWYGGEMLDCVIRTNASGGDGGGVYCYDGGTGRNCSVEANQADNGGGVSCMGAVLENGGSLLTNCSITHNVAKYRGGGVDCDNGGTLRGCTITHNTAGLTGGGADCFEGGQLNGCTIAYNAAENGGGVRCAYHGPVVTNCTITMNTAGSAGGGLYSYIGGIVGSCMIAHNVATNDGGGVFLDYGGQLVRCTMTSNSAYQSGGGVYCDDAGTVDNCIISANSARNSGGGAGMADGGRVRNSLLIHNAASEMGGGVYCNDGGHLENCTVADNMASNSGGGVYCWNGGELLNNIIYFNSAPSNANHGLSGSGIEFVYNCTTPAAAGGGNIAADPLFLNAANDFHLRDGSPCIDAGTNEWYVYSTTDLDGEPRLQGSRVDMGCYEDAGDPGVVPYINITNEPFIVADEVTSATIGGTNVNIVGQMGWVIGSRPGTTNWFARSGGSFVVTVTGLTPGANTVAVVGTNTYGHWAGDTVVITRGMVASAAVLCLWPEYIGARQTGTLEFAAYTAGTYAVVARATDGSEHTIVTGWCTGGWNLVEFTAASLPEQSAEKSNVVFLTLAGQHHVAGAARVVADLPTDKKTPGADLDGDSIFVKYKGAGTITSQGRTLFIANGDAKDSLTIKVKADKDSGDGTCHICGIYSDNGFRLVKVAGTLDRLSALGATKTILVKNGDLGHRCMTWRYNVRFQTAGGKSLIKVASGKHKATKVLQGGGFHANLLCGDTVQGDAVTGRGGIRLLSAVGGKMGLETTRRWLDAACVSKIVAKPKKDKASKQMRGGEIVDYAFYLTGEVKAGNGESVKKIVADAMVDNSGDVNTNLYLVCGCDAGSEPRAVTNWAAEDVSCHFGKIVTKNGGVQGTCVIDAWGKRGKRKQVKIKNGADHATWIVGGNVE